MCLCCESVALALRNLLNSTFEDRLEIIEEILNTVRFCPDDRPAKVIYPGYIIKY